MLQLFDELPAERTKLVRYEDVVREPELTLRRLLDALGQPFDERVLTPTKASA